MCAPIEFAIHSALVKIVLGSTLVLWMRLVKKTPKKRKKKMLLAVHSDKILCSSAHNFKYVWLSLCGAGTASLPLYFSPT